MITIIIGTHFYIKLNPNDQYKIELVLNKMEL